LHLRGRKQRSFDVWNGGMNKRQILLGVTALLVGTLVYLIGRPPDRTYFVCISPINISLYEAVPNLFGFTGNSLPSFVHVFSFILLTAGIVSCGRTGYLLICASWFLIDCAFELGQKFHTWSLPLIPHWFTGIPFLENTEDYFLQGTFDALDLFAIAIGTITAYILLLRMERRQLK
jgi:hypothetical protein